MKFIVLIIITLLVFIALSQKIKFGNIYKADGSLYYENTSVNNVEFIITYTTPSFYTSSVANDLVIPITDKKFQRYPLLVLFDAINCPVASDGTRATTVNTLSFSFPYGTAKPFKNLSCTAIKNIDTPSYRSSPKFVNPGPAQNFTSLISWNQFNPNLYNLINTELLFNGTSGAVITGDSTTINQNITLKIPSNSQIIWRPLMINRPYLLGISIANNQLNNKTTFGNDVDGNICNFINNGTKNVLYSPFVYKDFMITESNFFMDGTGSVSIVGSINVDFSTLSFT